MTTPGTAVATREAPALDVRSAVQDPKQLRAVIRSHWKTIGDVLPEHFTEERFAALVISAALKTPTLFKCTGLSILNAMYQAASIGLEINAATGEAYLIPYGDTAQLVPGYKGLVKLAIQSREVRSIEARLVYEHDTFDVFYGTESRVEHRPNFDADRTQVVAAYAVAKLPTGGVTFEVMTRKELDAIRARSAAVKSGKRDTPWVTDEGEMQRKTVTRRLCKYLPMSPQLARAVELSDRAETGEFENGPRAEPSAASASMTEALRAEAEQQQGGGHEPAIVTGDEPCEACDVKPGERHKDECPHA